MKFINPSKHGLDKEQGNKSAAFEGKINLNNYMVKRLYYFVQTPIIFKICCTILKLFFAKNPC